MTHTRLPRCLYLVAAMLVAATPVATAAERLLVHAKVFTANPLAPYAEAIGIRDGRIVAVGARDEVAARLGGTPEVEDLAGATVVPGFIDSHVHAAWGGVALISVDLENQLKDIPALVDIAREAKRSGRGMTGDVLMVTGLPLETWSHTDQLNARLSTGEFAAQPVFLRGMDGHTGWANAALRKRAGLTRRFLAGLDPERRKYYGFGADLEPNGFAVDAGLETIQAKVPPPSAAKTLAGAEAALGYLHGLGITSFLDPAADEAALSAYAALAAQGKLTAHVAAHVVVKPDEPEPLKETLALQQKFAGVPGLRVAGIKVFADGVVEYPSQTAAMFAPYAKTGKTGDLLFDPARFAALCVDADRRGLVIHVHAIGDRAVAEALNGIEAARRANGDSHLPHTITHLQFVRPVDIPRFHALGVIASVQLLWASAETDTIDLVQPYVDPAIYPWQYPARSLLDAGAVIAGASDWFVSSPNVFWAMYQAETRRGTRGVLDAGQDMPREAMLYAYTINAARAMHLEGTIGSLESGKQADLAVLDRDVLTVAPEAMRDTHVLRTMVGGEWVYRTP